MKLSVGNLVTDRYWESFKSVITVESVDSKGVNITASDDNKPYGMHLPVLEYEYTFEELQGIPLTEDWMLDFKHVEQLSPIKFRYKTRLFFLRDGVICDYGTETPLEFVHEFQNFIHAVMKEEIKLKQITA